MKYILTFIVVACCGITNAQEVISLSQNNWEVLEYSDIKPNNVNFTHQSMTIRVDHSASPMFYKLKQPKVVKEIILDAELMGALKLKKKQQGAKGNDDFTLRIGLVYQGKKRLGFIQRQIAAPWVKKLYSLAPKNVGVSHVDFFTVYQDPRLKTVKSKKSSSGLLVDNFVIAQANDGKIKATIKVPSNKNVLALWVNSDGDDTDSTFSVKLNKLVLK